MGPRGIGQRLDQGSELSGIVRGPAQASGALGRDDPPVKHASEGKKPQFSALQALDATEGANPRGLAP